MEENKSKLPLGILRQAVMKLDSFMSDMKECVEDEELIDEDKEQMEKMAEVAGDMMAIIVNMTNREIEESEFLNEHIDPDELSSPYDDDDDIMNEDI